MKLTGYKKSYIINKSKSDTLEVLGQLIQNSKAVKEGQSFFEGFEVLSTKTFRYNIESVSIYRAVLKVKEDNKNVLVESKVNTYWYAEFSLFCGIIMSLLFFIGMVSYYYLNPKEPIDPALYSMGLVWFLVLCFELRRLSKFKLEGQKAMDLLLEPLKKI